MRRHASVCTGCSTGCSIWVEENQDHGLSAQAPRESARQPVVDVRRRPLRLPSRSRSGARLRSPASPATAKSKTEKCGAQLERSAGRIEDQARCGGPARRRALAVSEVEEAYLLAKLLRSLDPQAVLALGPVPTVGEDEKFPGGFTHLRRKMPQSPRRGGSAGPLHAQSALASMTLSRKCRRTDFGGVWVSGGYKERWIDAADRASASPDSAFDRARPVRFAAVERATYAPARAAFAERDGSYVNRDDRCRRPTGPFARPGACGSKERCFGRCSAARGFTIPAPCWTI